MSEEQKGGEAAAAGDPAAAGEGGEEGAEEEEKIEDDETQYTVLGGNRPTSKTTFSMYTPPEPKTEEKYTGDEKRDHELVRRWRVVIQDIGCTNQTTNIINPFVKFIFGGDFYIDIKKMKTTSNYLPKGTKGISQFTEKISYLDAGAQQNFQSKIECTMQASYFQLMEEHLHIEVWEANSWMLNTFLGYESIRLFDVAQGSIMQSINIYDKIERDGDFKKLYVTLNFTLVFEEIWDYMVNFVDWRTTNLENTNEERPSSINPKLEFQMSSRNVISSRAESKPLKNTKIPYWQLVGKGIIYRGTYSQLQEEFLLIKLVHKGLTSKQIGVPKNVSLFGVLNNQLETQMQIHPDKLKGDQSFQSCSVKGIVRLEKEPMFQQTGTFQTLKKDLRYLVVYVTKINVIDAISAQGDPQVWVEVEWGGHRTKSRLIKSRPQLNQEFYFQLNIPEKFIKNAAKADLVDVMLEELRVKPEIHITVWADPANNTKQIISLGKATVPLNKLANASFQDRTFTDPKTRQKINFQSRVLNEKAILKSALHQYKGLNVELQLWFQYELPYPDIDIGAIKGSSSDVFPREFTDKIMPEPGSGIYENGLFHKQFHDRLMKNFQCLEGQELTDRLNATQRYTTFDFAQNRHIFPQFISKIASQDQNLLLAEENDDVFLDQLENQDWYKQQSQLARGIRTLKEVAHFVRCIQITTTEIVDMDNVWSTPDVMLTMREGQVHDHALLMASMFRAVKYEKFDQLQAAFVRRQKKINEKGGKQIAKLVKVAGLSSSSTQQAAQDESDNLDDSDDEDSSDEDSQEEQQNESDDNENNDSDNKSGASDSDQADEDFDDNSDNSITKGGKGNKEEEDENETIEDRVFVCVGRYKPPLQDIQAVWVMTLDQEFQLVTIWNTVQHKEVELPGRITTKSVEYLKAYLTPFKVMKDLAPDAKEKRLEEKYKERIKNWREEYMSKVEGIEIGEEDDEDEERLDSDSYFGVDDADQKEENSSDEEYKQDDDVIDPNSIIVRTNDLDQVLKGYRIENIGQETSLGEFKQKNLNYRENIEENIENDEPQTGTKEGGQTKNFFQIQREEMERKKAQREDKHLLPEPSFKSPANCDYGQIDFIFNHKNVWANLQNSDPCKIKYDIHDDTQWLPYVRDSIYPMQWDEVGDNDIRMFKKWQKFVEIETQGLPMGNLEINEDNPNWKKMQLDLIDYRIKGEFLQSFQPFYGPKEKSPSITKTEVLQRENIMLEEIVAAIKQMRSNAHINKTNMNWTLNMKHFIDDYVNYMEDHLAGRYNAVDTEIMKEKLKEQLRNLIPSSFQASIYPISVNFQDQEKVIALVKDKTSDFCTQVYNDQQFAVGVKIFPFDNRVVSLQIVIIRVEKLNANKIKDSARSFRDDSNYDTALTATGIEEEVHHKPSGKHSRQASKEDHKDKNGKKNMFKSKKQTGEGNIPTKKK